MSKNILHISPQFPQVQCWYEALGYEKATELFERHSFRLYKAVAEILAEGQPIQDEEVRDFISAGENLLRFS